MIASKLCILSIVYITEIENIPYKPKNYFLINKYIKTY